MKNIAKNLFHASALLAVLSCSAFSTENHVKYSIALVGMSMDYKEYDTNGVLADSETADISDILGYEMSLDYLFNRHAYDHDEIGINIMQLSGTSVYKGSLLGSGSPYGSLVSSTQNSFVDTSVNYKHIYQYKRYLSLSYGIGVGYHAWNRKLSSVQEELYEWFSVRPMLGASVNYKNIDVGMIAEYQYGFNATMQSSNPALDFTLAGTDIFEVTFPVIYRYTDNIEFFVKATFSKQTIKKSNDIKYGVYTYYEPDSTNYSNYIKLGAAFSF